jgi:hypothetical protein
MSLIFLITVLITIVNAISNLPSKLLNGSKNDPTPNPNFQDVTVDMKDWDQIVYFKKQFVSYIQLPKDEQMVNLP